jgi:hypothetical protein
MLSTVRADDLHRTEHRTTDPGCCREAQRRASIRMALEHGLSELALINTSVQSHNLRGPWVALVGTLDLRERADMQDFPRMHRPNVLLRQS